MNKSTRKRKSASTTIILVILSFVFLCVTFTIIMISIVRHRIRQSEEPMLISVEAPLGAQLLSFPIDKGFITAGYLNDRYAQKSGFSHYGIDIVASKSNLANILASGEGTILGTEFCDNNLGNIAVIRYDDVFIPETGETISLIVRYYHMINILIKQGDIVSKGQTIGIIDSRHKWYNHIHFEIDRDTNYPFNTPQVADKSSDLLIRYPADGSSIIEPIFVLTAHKNQKTLIHPNSDCCTSKDQPKFKEK